MIYRVYRKHVYEAWPMVVNHIAEACGTNPLQSVDMVLASLLAGRADLFLICDEAEKEIRGCMVLELNEYPQGSRVCNVWALAGTPGVWAAHEKELEELADTWAIQQGCDMIAMLGRPGWQKVLGEAWQTKPALLAWRPVNAHPVQPHDARNGAERHEPTSPGTGVAVAH